MKNRKVVAALQDKKTDRLVLTALMAGLVTAATMMIKIPVPMTEGYVHLGDSMIFLAVLILGKKNGALAAGIGSALGDLLSGYMHWVPWTLGIKFFMAFLMGAFLEHRAQTGQSHRSGISGVEIAGMAVAGCEMVAGYYVAASVIYGSWQTPLLSVPWNIGQFVVGIVVAVALSKALYRTPAKKFFRIS